MKFTDLIGRYCIGIQPTDDDGVPRYRLEPPPPPRVNFYMFVGYDVLHCDVIAFATRNDAYHHYSSWTLTAVSKKVEMTKEFKYIGETIRGVSSSENIHTSTIEADLTRWISAVGNGTSYGGNSRVPSHHAPYFFIKIDMGMKVLNLGVMHHDCCYPNTIWEYIKDGSVDTYEWKSDLCTGSPNCDPGYGL
jgi:hypothetical protein